MVNDAMFCACHDVNLHMSTNTLDTYGCGPNMRVRNVGPNKHF
jgi:hypothetical protein